MAKTIKEIADNCGVPEQTVHGWCRRNHVAKDAKDVAQLAKADDVVNQAIVDLLRNELEHKNKQIDELSKRLMESVIREAVFAILSEWVQLKFQVAER